MKPFDIEKCMAGDKVITREGREFRFGGYNPEAPRGRQVIGWIAGKGIENDNVVRVFGVNGSYYSDRQAPIDLFMADVEKIAWLNLYHDFVTAHETKEIARECRCAGLVACIQVTYVEGEGL